MTDLHIHQGVQTGSPNVHFCLPQGMKDYQCSLLTMV
ncbi:hypothetical protein glysoja_007200 [Glycine soja]|nr:hypothetical protein glysoja_007200 [Glycine soja]